MCNLGFEALTLEGEALMILLNACAEIIQGRSDVRRTQKSFVDTTSALLSSGFMSKQMIKSLQFTLMCGVVLEASPVSPYLSLQACHPTDIVEQAKQKTRYAVPFCELGVRNARLRSMNNPNPDDNSAIRSLGRQNRA